MKSLKLLFVPLVAFFLTVVILCSAPSNPALSNPIHWSYSGEDNPIHWGELSSEFLTCKIGNQQSPINITKSEEPELSNIKFNYKDTPFRVINNGHGIEVKYEFGSFIEIDEKRYELLQFHFHAPSEHTVEGKIYPVEAHLVHKSQDGKLAVVGVFMKEGKLNDFIETLWTHIPTQKGEKLVQGISVNASVLPPDNKSYYSYIGSLTTPPCSEGVSWNVMRTPIEISSEQIAKLTSVYSRNARPVQPLNQRIVKVKNF
ncbi:carbonic anhydrase family protein [Microcoleus sp. FACHB-53]|nr:carbonic anhydrase family protein [Microcoleus sp. FACHB-53]